MSSQTTIEPEKVARLRAHVQATMGCSKTIAQTLCAAAVNVNARTWERWEAGSREISGTAWELALIKLSSGKPALIDTEALYASFAET